MKDIVFQLQPLQVLLPLASLKNKQNNYAQTQVYIRVLVGASSPQPC